VFQIWRPEKFLKTAWLRRIQPRSHPSKPQPEQEAGIPHFLHAKIRQTFA
jgi:hypothetical protein